MERMQKTIAVIDIGSNSIRLQVARVIDKTYKVINDYKATVRIGDNVYKTGKFSNEAIDTLLQVLTNIKTMMDSDNVEVCRAVATASFREASNGQEVADFIKSKTGIDIEIISGIEEARLMYLAVSYYFQINDCNVLLVDMGGGSTEFSYAENSSLIFSESTPLGCSKLSYEYLQGDPPNDEQLKNLRAYLKDVFDEKLPKKGVTKLICSGGTINNISAIYNKRQNLSDASVKFVDTVFAKHFLNEIAGKKIEERLKISGVEPTRADIILSATLLVNMLLKRYNLEGFYTLSGGLRAGLTIDVMNKMGIELIFQGGNTDVTYARLVETGKKYYFDDAHAEQVTRLAKILFEKLQKILDLKDEDYRLLEAASMLHDIGQHISYSKHHKHSYYLITNTELPGFSDSEIAIIANIARYHRRSVPKLSHENYLRLSNNARHKVSKLASILRLADGLDRTHSQAVKDINVDIKDEKIIISLEIDKNSNIEMEKAGFDKKKDLLEKITDRTVELI